LIIYASKWTQWGPDIPPELISIVIEDVQGFMEVMHDVPVGKVDVLIHLPGGSAEACEALARCGGAVNAAAIWRAPIGDRRVPDPRINDLPRIEAGPQPPDRVLTGVPSPMSKLQRKLMQPPR
jgi:hypothetical protein